MCVCVYIHAYIHTEHTYIHPHPPLFFLSVGAILADCFRSDPAKLAAASGVLFAVISGGFGVGVGLSGLLPPGLRTRYALSTFCLAAALVSAAALVPESLPQSARVPFRPRSVNPLACLRLFRSGRTMRLLAVLSLLQMAPMFMGDTLQVYAMKQWQVGSPVIYIEVNPYLKSSPCGLWFYPNPSLAAYMCIYIYI